MVQSALASAAEALPPPAVSVPRGIKQTQQRGSGRLQFGQAIGRVEDAEADEEAAESQDARQKPQHVDRQNDNSEGMTS